MAMRRPPSTTADRVLPPQTTTRLASGTFLGPQRAWRSASIIAFNTCLPAATHRPWKAFQGQAEDGTLPTHGRLVTLQSAVSRTFADMNEGITRQHELDPFNNQYVSARAVCDHLVRTYAPNRGDGRTWPTKI